MNKEVVITTREGFKFTFGGELTKEIMENIYVDEFELVHFGKDRLIIPKDNLSYCWCKEN